MVQPATAFPGQPIALGRASRGIRLCALDPSALQRRVEVVVPKCGAVGQAQCLHQIAAAQLVGSDDTDQGRYLVVCGGLIFSSGTIDDNIDKLFSAWY